LEILDLAVFVLRIVFLVFIYVFIYVVLVHLIRELRESGAAAVPMGANQCAPGPFIGAGGDFPLLKVETAPEQSGLPGMSYELDGVTRLGRGPENDVVLPDLFASNSHAVIKLRQGQYWLEDLDSRNGTFLNNMPLTRPAVLAHNDQIRIGDIIFRFVRWDNAVEQDY